MYARDPAAERIGIAADEVRPGYARATLKIETHHLNGHGTAHGGILFMLADTAFAYACNSRGVQTVGSACDIRYHRPAYPGDTLRAVAEETYLDGRNGIYDVVVTNQADQIVAHFRGYSVALRRP